jgi:hypothetical protein
MRLGSEDYRYGALARIEDARALRDEKRWAGAIYLAGRAVEGLLRSLLWRETREQEIGHDLRQLLTKARSLGVVTSEDETRILDSINEIAVIWHNDLRFVGGNWLLRRLKDLGRLSKIGDMRVKGDPLKANAYSVLQACERVMARGDLVWSHSRKN